MKFITAENISEDKLIGQSFDMWDISFNPGLANKQETKSWLEYSENSKNLLMQYLALKRKKVKKEPCTASPKKASRENNPLHDDTKKLWNAVKSFWLHFSDYNFQIGNIWSLFKWRSNNKNKTEMC